MEPVFTAIIQVWVLINFNSIKLICILLITNRIFNNCGLHTIKTLEKKTRALSLIGISLLYFLSSDFNNATFSLILQNFKWLFESVQTLLCSYIYPISAICITAVMYCRMDANSRHDIKYHTGNWPMNMNKYEQSRLLFHVFFFLARIFFLFIIRFLPLMHSCKEHLICFILNIDTDTSWELFFPGHMNQHPELARWWKTSGFDGAPVDSCFCFRKCHIMCRVLILIERVINVLHELHSEHNYEFEIYRILIFSSILSVDNKLTFVFWITWFIYHKFLQDRNSFHMSKLRTD